MIVGLILTGHLTKPLLMRSLLGTEGTVSNHIVTENHTLALSNKVFNGFFIQGIKGKRFPVPKAQNQHVILSKEVLKILQLLLVFRRIRVVVGRREHRLPITVIQELDVNIKIFYSAQIGLEPFCRKLLVSVNNLAGKNRICHI